MKTTLAKVTGLALLAASFAFSGSLVYADTEDTTSAIQATTIDTDAAGGEIIALLDCDTEDGMGGCPVDTVIAAETTTTVADASDATALEPATEAAVAAEPAEPAARSVDAIIADINQTVVIVVTGDADVAIAEPAQTAAIIPPAAEPATEDKTTSDATASQPNEEKAASASEAIVVEVTPSATVPGQAVEDEPVVTGSVAEPSSTTPVSMLDGKNCDEDF